MLERLPAGSPQAANISRAIGEVRSAQAALMEPRVTPELLDRATRMIDGAEAIIAGVRGAG